jgi:hypothetical protein
MGEREGRTEERELTDLSTIYFTGKMQRQNPH